MLPSIELSKDIFFNKTSIIIGSSGSGKSFLIRDILYLINDACREVVIIAPEEKPDGPLASLVPPPLLFDKLNLKHLATLWERQQAFATICNAAYNIENMTNLYMKHPNEEVDKKIKQMTSMYNDKLKTIEGEDAIKKCREAYGRALRTVYGDYIGKNYKTFSELAKSDDELKTLRYINVRVNLALIIDDCTTELAGIKKDPVIPNIAFRGRHKNITMIIGTHTDKCLAPEVKKSIRTIVFTDKKNTLAYFGRGSNNEAPEVREQVLSNLEVFDDNSGKYPAHTKLILIDNVLYTTKASMRAPFKTCTKEIWDFVSKVTANQGSEVINNRFSKAMLQ